MFVFWVVWWACLGSSSWCLLYARWWRCTWKATLLISEAGDEEASCVWTVAFLEKRNNPWWLWSDRLPSGTQIFGCHTLQLRFPWKWSGSGFMTPWMTHFCIHICVGGHFCLRGGQHSNTYHWHQFGVCAGLWMEWIKQADFVWLSLIFWQPESAFLSKNPHLS
jgi:hypothetical protein